ncbi:LOW QUALITY PROTEIN: spore germination protein xc [Bacillus sp. JCM 19046]|nr:LOW QUALITY PROTEIN: spore germination protein xc [Bacillus sp. JCM 19046]
MKKAFFIVTVCFCLSGCWDTVDLQDMQYITAIAIDYNEKEKQFEIHGQSINFGNLSVSSAEGQNGNANTWVGISRGETVLSALSNLVPRTNQQLNWGHVHAIVYSQKALAHNPLIEMNEGLYRFQQVRMTPWVFGTTENLNEVLMVTNIFGDSIHTELFNPQAVFHERSFIEPITLHELMREYPEAGRSVKLPNLSILEKNWQSNQGETNTSLFADGAFVIKGGKEPILFSDEQLIGLRWLNHATVNAPLVLKENENTIAALNIVRPIATINSELDGDVPAFRIRIDANADIEDFPPDSSLGASKTINELKALSEETIKQEVKRTFLLGIEQGKDIYDLENVFYRQHVQSYNTMRDSFTLDENTPLSIEVTIKIEHTGEYEFYRDRVPESEQRR